MNVCVTANYNGDYNGYVNASVSPPFESGSTIDSSAIHIKGIPAYITAEPFNSTLSFGNIQLGANKIMSFNVCNYNTSSITISNISIDNSNFIVNSGINSVISANSCVPVGIKFAPQITSACNGNININTTGGNVIYTCTGAGIPGPDINTSSTGNGTITQSTNVNYGDSFTVTMTPLTGYTLDSLIDNGHVVGAHVDGSYFTYTLSNIIVSHSLVANFKKAYTISASVIGNGGTISPSSVTTSYYAQTGQNFTLTPQPGYILDTLIDNGADVTPFVTTNYTDHTYSYYEYFFNITQDHIIQASYKTGTISPPNPVPAISPKLIYILIVGISGYMFWMKRKRRHENSV